VTINTGSPEATNSTIDSFHRTPMLFHTCDGNFQKGILGLANGGNFVFVAEIG
jgi:hypothetical protein